MNFWGFKINLSAHLFFKDSYLRWTFLNVVISITLDCCSSKTDGTYDYKGMYKFAKSLAGKREMKNCIYNNSSNSSSSAFVNCIPDLEFGPSYGSLNVTSCQAKYKTTVKLEKLDQVGNIGYG